MEGEIGECISVITYLSKRNTPVEFRLYPMKLSKEYEWWPEKEHRRRKWVTESELPSLPLCNLLQLHLPKILDFLHNQASLYVCKETGLIPLFFVILPLRVIF